MLISTTLTLLIMLVALLSLIYFLIYLFISLRRALTGSTKEFVETLFLSLSKKSTFDGDGEHLSAPTVSWWCADSRGKGRGRGGGEVTTLSLMTRRWKKKKKKRESGEPKRRSLRSGEVMETHRQDSLTLKLSFSRAELPQLPQLPQLLLPSVHHIPTSDCSRQSHGKVQRRRDGVIYWGSNDVSEGEKLI